MLNFVYTFKKLQCAVYIHGDVSLQQALGKMLHDIAVC